MAIRALTEETRVFIGAQDFPTALAMVEQGMKTYGAETRLADLRETILVARADWERIDAVRQAVEEANDRIAQGAPEKASRVLEQALARFPGESALLNALESVCDALELESGKSPSKRFVSRAAACSRQENSTPLCSPSQGVSNNTRKSIGSTAAPNISLAKAEAQRVAAEIEFALQSAKSLSEQGQREEALALLESRPTEHPANPRLVAAIVETIDAVGSAGTVALDKICRSARQHMLTGDFDLAFQTIEQALRLHDDEQQAEVGLKATRGEMAKMAQAGSSSHIETGYASSVKEVTDEQALPGATSGTPVEIPLTDEYDQQSTAVFHSGFVTEAIAPPPVRRPAKPRFKGWWILAAAALLLVSSLAILDDSRPWPCGFAGPNLTSRRHREHQRSEVLHCDV